MSHFFFLEFSFSFFVFEDSKLIIWNSDSGIILSFSVCQTSWAKDKISRKRIEQNDDSYFGRLWNEWRRWTKTYRKLLSIWCLKIKIWFDFWWKGRKFSLKIYGAYHCKTNKRNCVARVSTCGRNPVSLCLEETLLSRIYKNISTRDSKLFNRFQLWREKNHWRWKFPFCYKGLFLILSQGYKICGMTGMCRPCPVPPYLVIYP